MNLQVSDVIGHVIALMQGINENVEGIETAPVIAPTQYSMSKMPMALVWEADKGEASGKQGLSTIRQNFVVEVLYAPATTGLKASNFGATRVLHARFVDAYLARINGQQDEVLDYGQVSGIRVQIMKDRPIIFSAVESAMVAYMPEVPYYGFKLSVPIMARWGSELL